MPKLFAIKCSHMASAMTTIKVAFLYLQYLAKGDEMIIAAPESNFVQEGGPREQQIKSDAKNARVQEASILLPRMPLGLRLVSGKPLYTALAAVCRTLGRLAAEQGDTLD